MTIKTNQYSCEGSHPHTYFLQKMYPLKIPPGKKDVDEENAHIVLTLSIVKKHDHRNA
jgi:hypothetical protein